VSERRASFELPVVPTSAAVARHVVEELLRAWDMSAFIDDLRLITSELITNVYMHTPSADSVELELIGFDNQVRVSVADGSSIKPVIRELDPAMPTGRGLLLVQALSSRWGSDEWQSGKRVWVEVDQPSAAVRGEG
jgi:anti-sigma regulatory factor (Ser/Thr protein kinase)